MKQFLLLLLLVLAQIAPAQVWESLGGGFWPGSVSSVYRDPSNGYLYAVGDFACTNFDGVRMNEVAFWDGSSWHQMGDGVDTPGSNCAAGNPVYVVDAFQNKIVVGGGFWGVDSVPYTESLAQWDGTSWSAIGTDSTTYAVPRGLSVIDGELHVVGGMDTIAGLYVPNWAIWDGTTWRPGDTLETFGNGLYKVLRYQGQFHAAGNYDLSNGRNDLTRLGSSGWEELGPGLLGDCFLHDMEVYGDLLWVTGWFFQASGNAASCLMAWDGYQWYNPFPGINYFAQGRDLLVANGKLYGSGLFDVAGKADYYGIWVYDGAQMCVIGGPKIFSTSLAASADTLYSGACLTQYCDGFSDFVGGIMKWPLDAPADTCYNLHVGVLEAEREGGFALYPNPGSSEFSLACSGPACDRVRSLALYDASGRLVTELPVRLGSALGLGEQAAGAYVARLRDGAGQVLGTCRVILRP